MRVIALLLMALCLAGCGSPAAPWPTATPFAGTPRPVIIDTDMAADDWLAILFVLQRQDLRVLAITVTGAGEAHCEPGVRHAQGLAALAGQPDIPVACGRETPLRGSHAFPAAWREGVDGLFGLSLPENTATPDMRSATTLITELAAAAPEPLTMLTLGPLTNVADALQASPELAGRLAMIYVMGGAVDAPGNVNVPGAGLEANTSAEWNIYVDPYAASVVLQSGAPVTLVPLDATNQVPVTLDFYQQLGAARHTPEAEFAHAVLGKRRDLIAAGGYYFWDPLAAVILADESLAVFATRNLTVVEAEGDESGRLVTAAAGAPVRFVQSVDPGRFEALFVEALNANWP